jgi:hypothetical protein
MKDILSTYYKCILSAITHKLNVSGHMLVWTFFVLVCGTLAQSLSASSSYTLYMNIIWMDFMLQKVKLTAFRFVCTIHAINRHVAPVVWRDAVGLVPYVLTAGLLPGLAIGGR